MKLSHKDFEVFKAECKRMIALLGLQDWLVRYRFQELDDALAQCETVYEGKIAVISLCPKQKNCAPGEVDVKRSARHEVIHLLLTELRALNNKRMVSGETWEAAEHAVVRRLEKVL